MEEEDIINEEEEIKFHKLFNNGKIDYDFVIRDSSLSFRLFDFQIKINPQINFYIVEKNRRLI